MFELNKRYTVQAPQGAISDTGISLIQAFITSQRLTTDDHWKTKNPDSTRHYLNPLPDDWNYVWVVTGRGEYVGTFPKRVSKYYYQTYGLKCPNEFLQEIGNIARQHSTDSIEYNFDIVDTFDWDAGDYGDSSSCYWGSNSEAREIMENEGGLAIRFYDENGDGFGRAWLAQLLNDRYIIFNGYGYTTLKIAHIFSLFMGLSYKKIILKNYGTDNGIVWINSGTGYLIGDPDKIANFRSYDLEWGDGLYCECGAYLDPDDCYFTPDGEPVCNSCFYERCEYCHDCGETHWQDNMYYIHIGHDVCERCYERNYGYCTGCEEDYHNRDLTYTPEHDTYCDNCLESHTTHCITCQKPLHDCTCQH